MSAENKEIYSCRHENCLSVFRKRAHLLRHELIHSDERPYSCTFEGCNGSFRSASHLKRHEQTHSVEKKFSCPYNECQVACMTEWNLKRHIKRTHKGPFKCNICSKNFKKNKLLRNHISLEHETKSVCCTFPGCNAVFQVPSKLKRHMKIHNKEYTCPEQGCSMKFKLWSECRQHAAVCTSREMKCSTCDKVFTVKSNLVQHQKIHEEERLVYQCTFQGCGRFYAKQSNLKVHVQSFHQNIRPFVCPKNYCNKAFHFKHLLRRHLEMHAKNPGKINEPPKKRRRTRRVNASLISTMTGYIPELWKKMTPDEMKSYVAGDDSKNNDSDSDTMKEPETTQNTCTPMSSDEINTESTITAPETDIVLDRRTLKVLSGNGGTSEADVSNEEDFMIYEPCKSIEEAKLFLENTHSISNSFSNSPNSSSNDNCGKYPIKIEELNIKLKKISDEQKRDLSNTVIKCDTPTIDFSHMQSQTESESDSEMKTCKISNSFSNSPSCSSSYNRGKYPIKFKELNVNLKRACEKQMIDLSNTSIKSNTSVGNLSHMKSPIESESDTELKTCNISNSFSSSPSSSSNGNRERHPIKLKDLTIKLKRICDMQKIDLSNTFIKRDTSTSDSCHMQSLTESESDTEMKNVQFTIQQCAS